MGRPLTPRERSVLIAMLTLGEAAEPSRYRRNAAGSGSRGCPRSRPVPAAGAGPAPRSPCCPNPGDPILLHGSTDGAGLLVSIDDDQPSYLELYPTGGQAFSEFPPPEALSFC